MMAAGFRLTEQLGSQTFGWAVSRLEWHSSCSLIFRQLMRGGTNVSLFERPPVAAVCRQPAR